MITIYLTETKSILTDGDWKKLWMEAGNANANFKNTVDSSDSPAFDDTEVSDNSCIFQIFFFGTTKKMWANARNHGIMTNDKRLRWLRRKEQRIRKKKCEFKSYQKSSFSNGNTKCNHFELEVIFIQSMSTAKNFNNDYTGWFRSFQPLNIVTTFVFLTICTRSQSDNWFVRWSNANLGNENTLAVVPTSLFLLCWFRWKPAHTY